MSTTGNDANDGKSKTTAWKSINRGDALGILASGDTVLVAPGIWIAWQYDRPDLGEGILQAFRRSENMVGSTTYKLNGLDAKARYKITCWDKNSLWYIIRTGTQLMTDRLQITLPAPSSTVYVYKRIQHLMYDIGIGWLSEVLRPQLSTVSKEERFLHNTRRLEGRKALVTRSGTVIGREIALEFAREGADVVLHYAHSEAGAPEAVREIQAMGRKAIAIKADFEVVEDVVRMGKEAIEFLGGIDALVNNSGITFNKPFFEVTLDQFNTLYFVNIRAQFFLTQHIAHYMVENGGGTVCNMTSIHGLEGAILVENSFNVIPGLTMEAVRQNGWKMAPNARIGNPLDIAKLAVFLTSYDSDYIVGQTIVADGGVTVLLSLAPDFRSRSETTFGKGYVPGA